MWSVPTTHDPFGYAFPGSVSIHKSLVPAIHSVQPMAHIYISF
eukprot:UN18202